jgi:hypothetical protein
VSAIVALYPIRNEHIPSVVQLGIDSYAPLPPLTHTTVESLLRLSQPQSGASASDHALALELLNVTSGKGAPSEHAVLQRLNLVGAMFDQIQADVHIPDGCKRQLEHLRYPMIKNVLVDASFLTLATHPLRQLLQGSLVSAAVAHVQGNHALRQIEQRLQDLPGLIDLSANFILPTLHQLPGLSDEQCSDFESQLTQQARERDQSVMSQVTRTVARELDEMTLGLNLPHGVVNFLQFGMHPLLSAILLKHGRDSTRWAAQMFRVKSLINSTQNAHAVDRGSIVSQLVLDLSAIGMAHDRIQLLLTPLNASSAH